MTELLKIGLRLAYNEDTSQKKRLLEMIPKRHLTYYDGKWSSSRELLQSTSIAGTNFVPAEVLNTVIEGGKIATCFRGLMPEYNTTSDTYAIPIGTGGGYAQKYSPGAPIKFREDALNTRPVTIHKYAELPAITDEMLNDAKVDEMAREIELAGLRLENALNQDMLTVLLDNAGLEWDTTGSNQGYKALIKARAAVKRKHFIPTAIVCCADAEAALLSDLVPSANAGNQEAIVSARLASLGMSLNCCEVTSASSTYTWAYGADGNIGMLVFDPRSAGAIVKRQDVQLEDYKDTLRGIVGAKATMRMGVQYAQGDSICRVEY